MTQCFQEGETIELNALSGAISFTRGGGNGTGSEKCTIVLAVPPGLVMEIDFDLTMDVCFDLILQFENEQSFISRYHCTVENAHTLIRGSSVQLRIFYKMLLQSPVELVLNFTVIPRPRLEVQFTSTTTGEQIKKTTLCKTLIYELPYAEFVYLSVKLLLCLFGLVSHADTCCWLILSEY